MREELLVLNALYQLRFPWCHMPPSPEAPSLHHVHMVHVHVFLHHVHVQIIQLRSLIKILTICIYMYMYIHAYSDFCNLRPPSHPE